MDIIDILCLVLFIVFYLGLNALMLYDDIFHGDK